MAGCIVGVWHLAALAGGGRRARIFAAVFVATLPSGVLQAVSTQNSYVLAFWMVSFACGIFHLRAASNHKTVYEYAIVSGLSLGLALLTKGTALFFAFPFLIWLGLAVFRQGIRKGSRVFIIIFICVLTLNAGHWIRNWQWFHSPFFPADEATLYRADSMTFGRFFANATWNLAGHLWIPNRAIAAKVQSCVDGANRQFGIPLSDQHLNLPGRGFHILPTSIHEDLSGNPIHLALVIACIAMLLVNGWRGKNMWRRKPGTTWNVSVILTCVILGFAAFCAGVRWLEYNVRLHLPLFVLAGAPVAIVVVEMTSRRILATLTTGLLISCIPYVVANPNHPVFGRHGIFVTPREEQYFLGNRKLSADFRAAADLVGHQPDLRTVGLAVRHQWEYPLWVMLRSRAGHWIDIQAIPADKVPPGVSLPDPGRMSAIITTDDDYAALVWKTGHFSHRRRAGGLMVLQTE